MNITYNFNNRKFSGVGEFVWQRRRMSFGTHKLGTYNLKQETFVPIKRD